MKSVTAISVSALISFFLPLTSANACSCMEFSPCEAFGRFDAVFIGKMLGGTEKVSEHKAKGRTVTYEAGQSKFLVEQVFKGVTTTEVSVFIHNFKGTSCEGTSLGRGERYLIYAHLSENVGLTIGACSPTLGMEDEDIGKHLEFLRRLPKPGTGGRLSGQVTAEIGYREEQPVAGATINIEDESHRLTQVKTDERGMYELIGLAPGKYTIRPVLPEGYVVRDKYQTKREVSISDRGCASGNFWVKINNGLRGTVKDIDGKPAYAYLSLISATDEKREITGWVHDHNGKFEVDGIPQGRYYLRAVTITTKKNDTDKKLQKIKAYWYYPGVTNREEASAIFIGEGQSLADLTFFLPPTLKIQSLEGTVKCPDGSPAKNIAVKFMPQDAKDPEVIQPDSYFLLPDTITDEQGRFALNGFKNVTYKIWAREQAIKPDKELFQSDEVLLTLDKDKTDFVLTLKKK